MSDPLHNRTYPDCPIWMRITDRPQKENTNMQSTPHGRRPVNTRFPWHLYEEDMIAMIEAGLDTREIAERLNLPRQRVSEKYARMVDSGECVPNTER